MQVDASVNYHIRKTTPQAFEFDVDGVNGKLVSPDLVASEVCVTDLRHSQQQTQFCRDGIEFISYPTSVSDFETGDDWHAPYNLELTDTLKGCTGAQEVVIFDHTVRIDNPAAPRRPARNVHIDYNQAGAEQRLIDLLGAESAEAFTRAGYGFVNVWRPIEHIIRSSPLGFIRPTSLSDEDLMDIGLIYPDRVGQITGVAANRSHQWFFKSEMSPDEIVIFNLYDNRGLPRIAHSALDLHNSTDVHVPRKSVESRTIVKYS